MYTVWSTSQTVEYWKFSPTLAEVSSVPICANETRDALSSRAIIIRARYERFEYYKIWNISRFPFSSLSYLLKIVRRTTFILIVKPDRLAQFSYTLIFYLYCWLNYISMLHYTNDITCKY